MSNVEVNDMGYKWTLVYVTKSPTSAIGNSITPDEDYIVTEFISNNSDQNFSIRRRTKVKLSSSPKLHSKWSMSQTIYNLDCSCGKVNYLIRRKDKEVLIYKRGEHYHNDSSTALSNSKRGLPNSLQLYLRNFVGMKHAQSAATNSLLLEEEHIQRRILGGLSIKDLRIDHNLKKRISQFLVREKKNLMAKTNVKSDSIGSSQKDLRTFLQSKIITVDEIVEYCKNGNEPEHMMWVLGEDVSKTTNGRFSYITFIHSESISVIRDAIKALQTRPHAFQAEIDYTHLDTDEGLLLGVLGTSDIHRKFHPLIYDLNVSENSVGSSRLLLFLDYICLSLCGKHISILKDASIALESAASNKLSLETRDCLAHKVRSKAWNEGKRSGGTRGSLETYLLSKGASKNECSQLIAIMLALDSLPSMSHYRCAIGLLHEDIVNGDWSFGHDATVIEHLKSWYFPLSPRIGPIHFPAETHSSNGLERHWFPTKSNIAILQKKNMSLVEATTQFLQNRTTVQLTTVGYNSSPRMTIEQWNAVRNCSYQVPGPICHMLVYVNGLKATMSDLHQKTKSDETRVTMFTCNIYIPTRSLLEKEYAAALELDVGNLDSPGRKVLRKAQEGSLFEISIQEKVASSLGSLVESMKISPHPEDTIYSYLERHGQRNSTRMDTSVLAKSRYDSAKSYNKRIKKEHEIRQEIDKWLQLGTDASIKKEPQAQQTYSPEAKKKKPQIHLRGRGLGWFYCVQIKKGISDSAVDLRNDGFQLTCTCEMFRVEGSCFETKLFGWTLLNRKPEQNYLPHQTEGLDKEREKIRENLVESSTSPNKSLNFNSPTVDPMQYK